METLNCKIQKFTQINLNPQVLEIDAKDVSSDKSIKVHYYGLNFFEDDEKIIDIDTHVEGYIQVCFDEKENIYFDEKFIVVHSNKGRAYDMMTVNYILSGDDDEICYNIKNMNTIKCDDHSEQYYYEKKNVAKKFKTIEKIYLNEVNINEIKLKYGIPMTSFIFKPETVKQISINPQIIKVSDGTINLYYFNFRISSNITDNDILFTEIYIPSKYKIYRLYNHYLDENMLDAKNKDNEILGFINYDKLKLMRFAVNGINSATIHYIYNDGYKHIYYVNSESEYIIFDKDDDSLCKIFDTDDFVSKYIPYHLTKEKFLVEQKIAKIKDKYNILEMKYDKIQTQTIEKDEIIKSLKHELDEKTKLIEAFEIKLKDYNALLEEFSTKELARLT